MGFFAYRTSDTDKTFCAPEFASGIGRPACVVATLLLPNGEKFTGEYDGYGRITDKNGLTIDIFSAIMSNIAQSSRECAKTSQGEIRDSFFKNFEGNSRLLKIVEDSDLNFDDVPSSLSCESQGYFFVGEEDDEYDYWQDDEEEE